MNFKKQRDRGRILTPDGLSRLQQAIRAWELEHEVRCTQERIRGLTSTVKEGGLDPGTIRKILKAREGLIQSRFAVCSPHSGCNWVR
jgi:hypothetical protein